MQLSELNMNPGSHLLIESVERQMEGPGDRAIAALTAAVTVGLDSGGQLLASFFFYQIMKLFCDFPTLFTIE